MRSVDRESVVWEVGSLWIMYDTLQAVYTLCSKDGPLVTYRGRSGLRQAWEAARAMEVGNG